MAVMLYSHSRQQKYQKDLRWNEMSEHIILSNISLGLYQCLY